MDFTDYSAPGTPRMLHVPDGAGDITVEDLWDTLSEQAAELDNLIYKPLIDRPKGGGRSTLTAVKSVGITLMLNNVQVKFPDQPGPGWVIKRVQDGNIVAQDHLEAAIEPLANSDFTNWKVESDVSAAGSQLASADAARLQLIADLMEADEVFDHGAGPPGSVGLLHYYKRGTTDDLVPPKVVTGSTATGDASAVE